MCLSANCGVQQSAREEEGYYIRSGIVCVIRNGTIGNNITI